MFVPHHGFSWLASLLDHIRFVGALMNPFTLRKGVSVARSVGSLTAFNSRHLNNENDSVVSGSTSSMPKSADIAVKPKANPYLGVLIINADDWGRDRFNTDRIRMCTSLGTVSSASAMVFMEDSERAAEIARAEQIDTGLHLNLTSPFTASNCPSRLVEEQGKLCRHLLRHRLAKVLPYPRLARTFEYVVLAQLEQYEQIYGKAPSRLDGHHHMHLCANVRFGGLMPEGVIVRRNFSFLSGEKSFFNRRYRQVEDQMLNRRHRMVDFFFSIAPLEPEARLQRIFSLAHDYAVEIETHPVNEDEFHFLTGDGIHRFAGEQPIAPGFIFPAT